MKNKLFQVRIDNLMSRAELARKAGISPLTVDRIEKGLSCRIDTKRKILKALGIKITDKAQVFP